MLMKITIIAFLGALLCLDRICLQVMVSRPIVAAPIIGLALGDFKTGLMVGAFLELLWVDRPALGNYIPPNDSLMAVLVTAAIILAGTQLGAVSKGLVAFSLLLLLPLSYATRKMEAFLTASNDQLSYAALADAEQANIAAVERKHLFALLKAFVATLAFIFLGMILGVMLLTGLYPRLPPAMLNALQLIYYTFPLLVVAVALNTIKMRGDLAVFCAIFVVTVMVCEIFYGLF